MAAPRRPGARPGPGSAPLCCSRPPHGRGTHRCDDGDELVWGQSPAVSCAGGRVGGNRSAPGFFGADITQLRTLSKSLGSPELRLTSVESTVNALVRPAAWSLGRRQVPQRMGLLSPGPCSTAPPPPSYPEPISGSPDPGQRTGTGQPPRGSRWPGQTPGQSPASPDPDARNGTGETPSPTRTTNMHPPVWSGCWRSFGADDGNGPQQSPAPWASRTSSAGTSIWREVEAGSQQVLRCHEGRRQGPCGLPICPRRGLDIASGIENRDLPGGGRRGGRRPCRCRRAVPAATGVGLCGPAPSAAPACCGVWPPCASGDVPVTKRISDLVPPWSAGQGPGHGRWPAASRDAVKDGVGGRLGFG